MKIPKSALAVGLACLTALPALAASVETPGFLKFECWYPSLRDGSLTGSDVWLLQMDPNFPATPDMASYTVGFSSRGVYPDNSHEQYGAKLSGWLTAPADGNYNFYIASDDASQLWIGTDATEGSLVMVAEEAGCCKGFLEPGNTQTTAWPIPMVKGQKYAVQILLKEGTGDDYVQVAMQDATGSTPANQLQPLQGMMISAAADPAGSTLAITQQPVSVTTAENTPASFSIAVNASSAFGSYTAGGTPTLGGTAPLGTKAALAPYYQWLTNGVAVPGANAAQYNIPWPKRAQDGLKVKCYVAIPGLPLYSSEATLTVTPDTTAPVVQKVAANALFTEVGVTYSEPVTDSALNKANYQIDQGVTVASVARVDGFSVKLTTSRMPEEKTFTLTINNVEDTATPANKIAANTTAQFKSFVFVSGVSLRHKYLGFDDNAGGNQQNLFNDARYPDQADSVSMQKRFEYPADAVGHVDENPNPLYFNTLDGYFIPPTTGNYVFYISFADRCWLYLSTDEDPANKHMVLGLTGWSDPRNWLTSHDYNPDQARTDRASNTQWPDFNTITLQANKRYYMELIHHRPSWAGGEWFAATYKLENDTDPANGTAPKLAGTAIGSYLDPSVGSVTFTAQPQNVAVSSGTKATFTAAATGSSSYTTTVGYQWQSAPKGSSTWTDIAGATSATYTTPFLVGTDDGTQYRVIAMAVPIRVTSSVATVSVSVDTAPPTVDVVSADMSWTAVTITFSEPVTDTALQTARYAFDQGLTHSAVVRVDPKTVKITTSRLAEGGVYHLAINGVQDTATPPNTIAANTVVEVRAFSFMIGAALRNKYMDFDNGVGASPDGLFNDARFPYRPDRQDMVSRFEYPPDGIGRIASEVPPRNFFDTVEGMFIPPANGDYVFFIAGADRFWLYLSEDESPANKHLIAAQPNGWTQPRNWMLGEPAATPPDISMQRSDQYVDTQWPQGNTITLQAGKRYYMLEVHHDPSWCGADHFAATYKLASEQDPNNGDTPRLAGSVIGYYFNPSGADVEFETQPLSVSAVQGRSASFTVAATGTSVYGNSVLYQWQSAPVGSSAFTDIPGATSATYQTPFLTLADNGRQYRVIASVPPYSEASAVATLTVQPDTFPPVATAAAMSGDTAGVVNVGVGFDEPVDEASAKLLANYSVSPGTITQIQYFTNRFTANSQNPLARVVRQSVLLTVTGLSGSGTVTVKNVADTYGNPISSQAIPITVNTTMKWGVVGANEFGGWNAVVPVTANGFDLYSDGFTSWERYDEATLVYEEITGDFDKQLRVAYQDGSSEWARAGLIARETLSFGVDRATQATTASRYQKCLVYPVGQTLQGPGVPGTASWALNRRLEVGGTSDGATMTGANSVPLYPEAWVRLKRSGQTFTMFRSDDGENWIELGSTTWGVDDAAKLPMPDKLYVGADFSPEIGNITNLEDRGTFLAQVRNYGNVSTIYQPPLQVGLNAAGKVVITWSTGTLVSSPTLNGAYTPVQNAVSPFEVTPGAGTSTFYRLMQ